MVVINPCLTPKLSFKTFTIGAKQLVVQEAFDITWCAPESYCSWFTPKTMVKSSLVAGAEMITFFTPSPRCAAAFLASVNTPVDSITISMPNLFQGMAPGSLSDKTLISFPSIKIESSFESTVPGYTP